MKREALQHTKMKRLCRRLDIPLWQGVGLLESIWHLTARETPRGDLGKLSDEDIAVAIDYHGDISVLIDALVSCGWLDRNEIYRLIVHDWFDHADDSVHMRLARGRAHAVRTDGSSVRPKTNRLPQLERKLADEWYDANPECAHAVRTESQSVRTESQSVHIKAHAVHTPSRSLSLSLSHDHKTSGGSESPGVEAKTGHAAAAEPDNAELPGNTAQSPPPKDGPNADLIRELIATNGNLSTPPRFQNTSQVARAVRKYFPSADDKICRKIEEAARGVFAEASDEEIALAVLRSHDSHPDQRKAALYLTTVPEELPKVLYHTRRSEPGATKKAVTSL